MKDKQWMLKKLYCTLAELESNTIQHGSRLETQLKYNLELLYEILEEEVDEEYWSRIEALI